MYRADAGHDTFYTINIKGEFCHFFDRDKFSSRIVAQLIPKEK